MRGKYRPHHILEVVLLFIALAAFSESNSKANENSKYLDAVREFADNVLKDGRDTYGPKHTPLFVDGLNIHTHEPAKWIAPNGDRWVLSNLASQQNLFRTLDGLTRITGDPKYKQAAMDAIEYAFENLRSPNRLFYWGNITAYDAEEDNVVGREKPYQHVLKANLPYYELMWQVNQEATKTFIESFWSAHVKNWSNLAMDRIASFNEVLEEPWKHIYEDGPAFLKSGSGTSFLNAGTDLAYAAAMLAKLSGDKEPLVWAKRIIHRYVRTRHPKTGISYWMYTKPSSLVLDSYDNIMRKLVPGTTEFLSSEFPWSYYINPLYRGVTRGQFTPTPGIPVHSQVFYWQTQFLVGEMFAEEGNVFKQWALEELTAFGNASYREKDNVYVPILTDGTSLEGYVVKVTSKILGPKGAALEFVPVCPPDLWAYAMGYRVTNDKFMWEMTRNISKGNQFGDIGATPQDRPQLDLDTSCSNPYALLAFLELYRGAGKDELLHMANRIGDNILAKRFHKGFFVASTEHVYTKFDAIDSLALLHLYSALAGDTPNIPRAWPSLPYFYCSYRSKDWTNDNEILYAHMEPSDPPLSLLEAASLGNIEEVRAIISRGTGVDAFESSFFKTALHEAAIGGHKEIVELLVANGAQVDARDTWPGTTPLNYAAEKGHKDIIELLIAKGADINATRRGYPAGDTPLHSAVRSGHRDIIALLIAKKADVNVKNKAGQTPLDIAVRRNRKDIVELLITKGADINAKNNDGQTPVDIAVSRNRSEVVKLLISKGADVSLHLAAGLEDLARLKSLIEEGADVNAENLKGETPIDIALNQNHKDIVELLLEKGAELSINVAAYLGDIEKVKSFIEAGADVNTKDGTDFTPLHSAAIAGHISVAKLLIDKGAAVSVEPGRGGRTPLYCAVKNKHKDVAELLIDKGADVSSIHLLYYACWYGYRDFVELFIQKGADANSKNWGESPSHYAVWGGHADILELLLAKGADANAKDTDGWSLLHYTAGSGSMDMTKILLDKDADVNAKENKGGQTPLHRAVEKGRAAVAELLIANGADVNAKENEGKTALSVAKDKGNTEIVELLRKHGAKEDKAPESSPK